MRRLLVALVASVFATSGCSLDSDPAPQSAAQPTAPPAAAEPSPPAARAGEAGWRLISGKGPAGEISLGDEELTLEFRPRLIAGFGGCNEFSVRARVRGNRVETRWPVTSTAMGCGSDIDAREQAYTDALLDVERREASGDRLILTGPSTELVFESITPLDPGALVGPTWTLESVTTANGRTEPTVRRSTTLRFTAAGRIDAETACRGVAGRYAVEGREIVILRLQADRVGRSGCSPAAVREEEALLTVFSGPLGASVEGDRLTLLSLRGASAVYRAD